MQGPHSVGRKWYVPLTYRRTHKELILAFWRIAIVKALKRKSRPINIPQDSPAVSYNHLRNHATTSAIDKRDVMQLPDKRIRRFDKLVIMTNKQPAKCIAVDIVKAYVMYMYARTFGIFGTDPDCAPRSVNIDI